MTLLRNEKVVHHPVYGPHVEAFCPYCRSWQISWGGGSQRRGRHVCSQCTWLMRERERKKWGCIA